MPTFLLIVLHDIVPCNCPGRPWPLTLDYIYVTCMQTHLAKKQVTLFIYYNINVIIILADGLPRAPYKDHLAMGHKVVAVIERWL